MHCKVLHRLISTWLLSGTVKKMPGTIGSLAAYPIAPLILVTKISGAIIIFFLLLIGLWSIRNYSIYYNVLHDSKEIVIDEVVGQLLTIFLVSTLPNQKVNYSLLILCFFLFRFFDIVKAWPTNLIDKNVESPLGIMLDDIIAAIFAYTVIGAACCLLSIYRQ